jgi:hypothetical protein
MAQILEGVEPASHSLADIDGVEGTETPRSAQDLFAAIRDSGLIGMWKRRKDIADSAEYARELRQRAQERQW